MRVNGTYDRFILMTLQAVKILHVYAENVVIQDAKRRSKISEWSTMQATVHHALGYCIESCLIN